MTCHAGSWRQLLVLSWRRCPTVLSMLVSVLSVLVRKMPSLYKAAAKSGSGCRVLFVLLAALPKLLCYRGLTVMVTAQTLIGVCSGFDERATRAGRARSLRSFVPGDCYVVPFWF